MALSSKGFSGSPKMNKDADERVVPNGEYRDALNVQVTSSDDSEVGSLQSLLGNTLLSINIVPEGSKCVGSIADNKSDKIYYFVAGPVWENTDLQEGIWKDYIIQHDVKTGAFKYVFVDIYKVQLRTIGPSVGRDLPVLFNVATSPWTHRGAIRRDMPIAAFNASGTQLSSPNWTLNNQLTEVINFLPTGISTANVNIYSTMLDYSAIALPAGTLLRFQPSPILNFHEIARQDKLITGINIIDDMLLWTDNYSEPKKINIDRCIAGTGGSVELPPINNVFSGDNTNFHTRLCVTPDKNSSLMVKPRTNNPNGKPWYILEENVTVIRKGPRNCPRLIMSRNEDGRDGAPVWASTTAANTTHIAGPPSTWDNSFAYLSGVSGCIGSTTPKIKKDGDVIENVSVATPVNWKVGDLILFNQQQDINSAEGFTDHDVRCIVTSIPSPMPPSGSTGPYNFLIDTIDEAKIDIEQKKWNLRLEQRKPLFEFKFARFAFRYKYEDGEYSTFSPWSEPAFLPGEYDYLPVKGYNLGMTNRLRQLKVTGYIPEDMPQDVIQVDILYKDESSPNIYLVEEIISTDGWSQKTEKLWPDKLGFERKNLSIPSSYVSNGDNAWRGEYKLTSELIHKTLPSNQLLRQWDNVPRLALAQEISGNRLVFGNYIQNFDLTDPATNQEIRPLINLRLHAIDAPLNVGASGDTAPLNNLNTTTGYVLPRKTCRSLRTYQVGVVYGDEYGRETPVLAGADGTGSIIIPIENSSTINQLRVDIGSKAPSFAKYYKFFIKETSNEYYNLAMDRWYDAEDGNIWLSFASADRNKVDLETHITLKKKHDKHVAVTDKCTYKILAIENKAPDFIKTNIKSLGFGKSGGTDIGTSATGFPIKDADEVWIKSTATGVNKWFNSNVDELMPHINAGTLHLRVRTTSIKSKWYQVTKLNTQAAVGTGVWYKFKLDKLFGEDMGFTSSSATYQTRVAGLMVELSNHKVENKKEFEGRFFVKIYKDLALYNNLLKSIVKPKSRILHAQPLGYWNLPQQEFDLVGDNICNWERVAINCDGELDCDSGFGNCPVVTSNYAALSPDAVGATGRCDEFFFKTYQSGWIRECGNDNCAARDHTKEWMNKSEGLFHIDSSFVRGSKDSNQSPSTWYNCTRKSFKDDTNLSAPFCGRGISNGGLRMDIGYVHPGDYGWKVDTDKAFYDYMVKIGTTFRFREDPDQLVYIVTGSVGNSATDSHYGKHHTWRQKTSVGMGNNKSRFRVDFERADQPCTGLGSGPAGYHILGNKRKTKNPNLAELGYYGGGQMKYIGGSDTQNSHNSGEQLRCPAPPNTYDSSVNAVAGGSAGLQSTVISDPGINYWKLDENGDAVSWTGRQQALRWRESTARYHYIEIIEPVEDEDGDWSSKNPAVWETEPKEDVGMDIYYEASPALPITISASTNELFAPYGSMVNRDYNPFVTNPTGTTIQSWSDNRLYTTAGVQIQGGDRMRFTRPDGFATTAISNADPSQPYPGLSAAVNTFTIRAHNQDPAPYNPLQEPPLVPISSSNNFSDAPHNQGVYLSWYNAFTWGNGIESDRIRDDFNQVTIANGVKASTVMATPYKEERRKTGLIHSGIYNSTSGVNSLNQFIQAETITKDMNPTYGSIQKLYTTDGNIVAFHEDRVMKILAQKDALYNAGGGKNVAISSNFLGSDEPYATTHGISTNPESFAVDSFGRQYFADRSRSAICRLSQSGIDAISTYGMKDWFDDHLNGYTTKILGSFDEKKGLYNVTIFGAVTPDVTDKSYAEGEESSEGPCDCTEQIAVGDVKYFGRTLSFSEETKGWTTFKSFVPEDGVSINNEYYTFNNGDIYKHHSNNIRNNFYGEQFDSSVAVIFNDEPASVKSFMTINYEGSQARTTSSLVDSEYHNLNNKDGWYVDNIVTDLQDCKNLEFVDKEGKWFSYIQGATTKLKNLDESEFSVQGIGVVLSRVGVGSSSDRIHCLTIKPNATCSEAILIPDDSPISGCMDPTATNYNSYATTDDGSCDYNQLADCMDPNATNYNSSAVTPCVNCCTYDITGCMDVMALNYNQYATINCTSCCIAEVIGCTNSSATNYNPSANTDDGSCEYCIYGCMDYDDLNYDGNATCNDSGYCIGSGSSSCTTVVDLQDAAGANMLVYIPDPNFRHAISSGGASLSNLAGGSWSSTDYNSAWKEADGTLITGVPSGDEWIHGEFIDASIIQGIISLNIDPSTNGVVDSNNNPQSVVDSLEGLQCFTGLTYLYATGQGISGFVNLSGLNSLETIYLENNLITSLSGFGPTLDSLFCSNNQLTSLDVSGAATLTSLDCSDNPLMMTLDIANGNNWDGSNGMPVASFSATNCGATLQITCDTPANPHAYYTVGAGCVDPTTTFI